MTTAAEAKARILTLLRAASDLSGVTIRYGQATREAQVPGHPDIIYLGRITQGDDEAGELGRRASIESYSIAFTVATFLAGDDEVAAEERLSEILTAILDTFKADGQTWLLGINGGDALLRRPLHWSDVSIDSVPYDQPPGWMSTAVGQLDCVATVRPAP